MSNKTGIDDEIAKHGIHAVNNLKKEPIKIRLTAKDKIVSDLMNQPVEEEKWLVEKIWPEGARGFIAGQPGTGKTWLALDLALSVCTGRPFLDTFTILNPGAVILIEEEASQTELKTRFHALIQPKNFSRDELDLLQKFHYYAREFIKIPKMEEELLEIIQSFEAKLIIFDSFRRIHDSKENSSDEMQVPLECLARIQQKTGISIILIHHLNKTPADSKGSERRVFERMRGSGDLWAWRDAIIGMEEQEEDSNKAKITFQLRSSESLEPFFVVREKMPDNGIMLRKEENDQQDIFKQIVARIREAMIDGEPVIKTEILKTVKGQKKDKFSVFKWLVEKGQIKQIGEKYYWYQGSYDSKNLQEPQEL